MLRPYQQRSINDLRGALIRHRAVCYVLPCGGGKTTVAAEIIRLATNRGRRVLFLAHSKELVENAAERIRDRGLNCGIIKAGVKPEPQHHVQVASKDTLLRRTLPPADLVFADECHRSVSKSWRALLDQYPQAHRIGLTATPYRLDGRGLGDVYSHITVGATVQELIDGHYLTIPTVYSHPRPDLTGVRTTAGDYNDRDLADAVNKPKLLGDIIEHWRARADGKPTVAFAVNIAHSIAIRDAFLAVGVAAGHVDGSMTRDQRTQAFADLRAGRTTVLSNCQLIVEGVDLPALQCAILARPTKSLMLHRQAIGRVMRASPGKIGAVVLDHAGNTIAFGDYGFVECEPQYTLTVKAKPPRPTPVKNCPGCLRTLRGASRVCPECGFVFTARESEPPTTADGQLVRVQRQDDDVITIDATAEYSRIVDLALAGRYGLKWARNRYRAVFGKWPRLPEIEGKYKCEIHEMEREQYGPVVRWRCAKCLRARESIGGQPRSTQHRAYP